MAEKDEFEVTLPKHLSLFRLVVDQARVTQEVLKHPYPGSGTQEEPYIVTYTPDDVGNPFNWTSRRRWTISWIVAAEVLASAFASSA